VDGDYYVIEDATMKGSPRAWAGAAVNAYYRHKADKIIAEKNFGGAMVKHTIEGVTKNVRVEEVTATRGKVVRAEPIALLYEKGRVHHAEEFPLLEDQMTKMTPGGYIGDGSPDRLDAKVWALTELSQGDVVQYAGMV
jgi:phage terminase large subunit-like protein